MPHLPESTAPGEGNPTLSRRDALAALGVGAVATAASAFPSTLPKQPRTNTPGAPLPGWDAAKNEYTLPPLPYAFDALEPHLDAKTMEIHHGKHHAGYVKGLNTALTRLRELRDGQGDASLIKHWAREVSFHGSGHVNHTMFWESMAPAGKGGGGTPTGPLAERINRDFGSFEQFVAQFKAAANAVEGSGWGWLVFEPIAGRLVVIQGEKQQDLMLTGVTPLLGIDVWEHAYYLKYQNRRSEYVDAFMNVVAWAAVERRFAATGSRG